ncbi:MULTISPECIES: thiol-disulfide oxidoreductase DCC family protein [Gracilibacillus]|uniref:DUF393 domain-containing protein n=1 Tax=Gracilibacillus dipsosauri TaxID=178340 RepID=A0A317KW37_9BACI|nr:thiol-disulfide oxidoreductase DCC family protein [Gracilibacillus dipsosauri]PWU67697.1 DUF393 domain-containing protein [Gracilibacillus dipsosauri]
MKKVILFDGVCNFCNHSVQFIIKHDPKQKFQFASLQSKIGEQFKKDYHIPHHIDSIVLIDEEKAYTKSTAALRIAKELKGLYKGLYVLLIIPKPIRDKIYQIVAKNRYRWFGKRTSCMIPNPEDKQRFLD